MRGLNYALAIAALVAPGLALGADVLSQLGIPIDLAQEAVGSVLTAGVSNPGLPASAFKLLPPAARAQTTTAGVAWLKAYIASPDFTRRYAQLRQARKPEAPTWATTPEQELQKADDDQKQQLEESKRAIASLPPDQRKLVEDDLKAAAEKTAKMDTPESRTLRLDNIKAGRANEIAEYNAEVAKWSQAYPVDPRPIIVKRLREFLQLSADVDFDATLKTSDGLSTFENPAYRAKSSQWKMCYRAGREATEAARTAVQAWLTELGE